MKKTITLLILNLFFINDLVIFAKRSKNRKSANLPRTKKSIILNKEKSPQTKEEKKDNKENITHTKENHDNDKDTSHINKYNCEKEYIKCMNITCFNNKTGKCKCAEEINFSKSNEKCSYITNICKSKELDIVSQYKRSAKNDCLNKNISDNKIMSIDKQVAELNDCMQQKCSKRGEAFINCFDEDKYEKKIQVCKKYYENSENKEKILKRFKDSLTDYKKYYCEKNFGTLKSDNNCYLKIGIGASFKTIQSVKEFKIGDNIICSEQFFGTELGKSKVAELERKKSIALFSLDMLSTSVGIAESVTTAVLSGDIAGGIGETTNELISGVTSSEHLTNVVMAATYGNSLDKTFDGYCYAIKGDQKKLMFNMDEEIFYKLQWSSSWSENGEDIENLNKK